MADIVITRELTESKGRYVGKVAGMDGEAELIFIRSSPSLVIANHTLTPVPMRGLGIATSLVERLIADARSEGFKIVPRCTFVKAQFERHSDWSDLLVP